MEKNFKKELAILTAVALLAGAVAGILVIPALGFLSLKVGWLDKKIGLENLLNKIEGQNKVIVYEEKTAVIDVVEKANPAVVSIVISKDVSKNAVPGNLFPFEDFNFGFPFNFQFNIPNEKQQVEPKKEEDDKKNNLQRIGGGSGFIIQSDGLIVTNKHVVSDEEATFTVVLSSGKEYPAEIVARDPFLDVALIKIDAKDLSVLSLGDSDKLKIGQNVVAIGYALAEYGNTVTVGVVSGKGRKVEAGDGRGMSEVLEEAIQTDAAINPGNSGGPLLNLAGEVVGINTAVASNGQSVGFAIPINSLKKTIESVQKNGKIVRPWLGVRYAPVTPRLVEVNNLKVSYGALILRGENQDELAVIPGSPADKAGLVENDIILEVGGVKLEDKNSLSKEIAKYNVGDEIKLKVFHKGEEKEIKVKLEEYSAK